MKVLVVDDNQNDRKMLSKLLVSNGYEPVEACNGIEALEIVKSSKPDLIISDIMMPEMDGFTLLRELGKDETARDIPFIFYTAHYISAKDKELATALAASRFLIKPVEPKEILSEKGLKYHKGFCIGAALFIICVLGNLIYLSLPSVSS